MKKCVMLIILALFLLSLFNFNDRILADDFIKVTNSSGAIIPRNIESKNIYVVNSNLQNHVDLRDNFISIGSYIRYNVTNSNDQRINILIDNPKYTGYGFNFTSTWADWGEFSNFLVSGAKNLNIPFNFVGVNSQANFLEYNGKIYTGYISGTGSYKGIDSGSLILENKGLGIWDFYYHMNFVPVINYSDYNESFWKPTDTISGDFYLTVRMNESTRTSQGKSYLNGEFIIFNKREQFDYHENKISILDSFKENVMNTINNITSVLNIHSNKISLIENGSQVYLKYLTFTDRKNIICGYAEDHKLNHYQDLLVSCDLFYNSRLKASCRCKDLS